MSRTWRTLGDHNKALIFATHIHISSPIGRIRVTPSREFRLGNTRGRACKFRRQKIHFVLKQTPIAFIPRPIPTARLLILGSTSSTKGCVRREEKEESLLSTTVKGYCGLLSSPVDTA